MYETTKLDYSPESGSANTQSKRFDARAPIEHDGRSPSETKFNPSEAPPSERDKYRRLARLNDRADGGNDINTAHRRRDAATFCNEAGLTGYQTKRVVYLVDTIEFSELGNPRSEVVILALITLVADSDVRLPSPTALDNGKASIDGPLSIRDTERFEELRESLEVSTDEIRSLRTRLRNYVNEPQ